MPLLWAVTLYANLKMVKEYEQSCAIDLHPASKIIYKFYLLGLVKVYFSTINITANSSIVKITGTQKPDRKTTPKQLLTV